jgi:hypothetical protein
MSSWQTFSREATLRELRVMRILWIFYPSYKTSEKENFSWVEQFANVPGPRRNPSQASGKTFFSDLREMTRKANQDLNGVVR